MGSQPANTTLKICNLGTIAGRSLPRKMGTVGRGWIRRGVLKMSEHIILSPSERNIYNLQVSGNTTTTGWKRYYLIDTSASVHITLYHTHTFPDWRPPYKPWFNTESVHCGGMGYQAYNSSFNPSLKLPPFRKVPWRLDPIHVWAYGPRS